jgi:thiamine biosynthesis lipoprotein
MLANAAVSSSGDLYQFIEIAGRRRSHVLDPHTGVGVPGPRLVTVIASTSTQADAADTALCVMTDEAALDLAKRVGNIEVRIATLADDGKEVVVHTTSGFERYLLKEIEPDASLP